MCAFFLDLVRTILFLSSSPFMFRLRMISLMVVLDPHGEVEKAIHLARLATHNLLVSLDDVVGLQLIAATLAENHMATVLPNCVMFRRW